MEYLALIGTVTLIHVLAVMSPGPDFIMAVRNSLTYSRRTGIWTAVGIGMGIMVHIFYSVAGLALIISKSILLFNAIKFLGAGYLIYIGIKSFRSKSSHIDVGRNEKKTDISALRAIRIGFLTNVLNPKATIFFLSLFTLVLAPDTPGSILAVLSVIMVTSTMCWFSLVAIMLTHRKIRGVYERFQGVFSKTFGALLVGLGVKVALSHR